MSRFLLLLLLLLSLIAHAGDAVYTGTAFIIHPDGYLVTCNHVVEGATDIQVYIGATSYKASLLAVDTKHDLALIQIQLDKLTALPLANSNLAQLGEEVRACGFPLASTIGKDLKVTRGTISGITTLGVQKVFQVDAPINPGNSGGPLINEKGEVLGVVNAKLTAPDVEGVGFSVPINYVRHLLSDEGVEMTESKSADKLDGPALVKRVAASIAFVKVTVSEDAAEKPPVQAVVAAKHFSLVNDNGDELASLFVSKEDGQPVLALNAKNGKSMGMLYMNDTGPVLTMYDKDGIHRLSLKLDGDGDPGLMMYRKDDNLGLYLFSAKDGETRLDLIDADGKTRLSLLVDEKGAPQYQALNAEEKLVWSAP